ncbi:MAG: hypothetical protein KAI29_08550 [Cyclobacteriaceae bacterium]|nr:hypothetical protein [Cyclobacteriaceae bacterium]
MGKNEDCYSNAEGYQKSKVFFKKTNLFFSRLINRSEMDEIIYKKNASSVMERLKLFYERKTPDQIFANFKIPSQTMDEFRENNKAEYISYPNPQERAQFWDHFLEE